MDANLLLNKATLLRKEEVTSTASGKLDLKGDRKRLESQGGDHSGQDGTVHSEQTPSGRGRGPGHGDQCSARNEVRETSLKRIPSLFSWILPSRFPPGFL